jgi:hypothetical protein
MRRFALITLIVSTAAIWSGCRDFTSSGDPLPEIQGSLDADLVVPAEGTPDLGAEGWQVSIRFVENLFIIVRLPPEEAFRAPEIDFGRFTTGPDQVISFYDEDDELLETADYEITGQNANVLLLDFERGSLGFQHVRAAVSASSEIGSHAPKTRSSRSANGTNSRISGDRPSVLLPRRMVAIWVSDPMGLARPRRTLSTPAMNVVETAPKPGSRTPSLPVAGAMRVPRSADFTRSTARLARQG